MVLNSICARPITVDFSISTWVWCYFHGSC